jgi:hypothetical protein
MLKLAYRMLLILMALILIFGAGFGGFLVSFGQCFMLSCPVYIESMPITLPIIMLVVSVFGIRALWNKPASRRNFGIAVSAFIGIIIVSYLLTIWVPLVL